MIGIRVHIIGITFGRLVLISDAAAIARLAQCLEGSFVIRKCRNW
jgi:hypothetical protein